MRLSVVIISYNTKKLLKQCLDSIEKHTKGIDYEVIVVDNASTDGSVEMTKRLMTHDSRIKLLINKVNLGFAAANNQGLERAKGDYVLFLNSDTKFTKNVLRDMIVWMDRHQKVGVASCKLKNKDGTLQSTGGCFPTLIRVFSWMIIQDFGFVDRLIQPFHPKPAFYKAARQLDWVTGAFMLVRTKAARLAGGWDEDFFMYTEEVDFCYRIKKKGWRVWYLPNWSIVHLKYASSTSSNAVLQEFKGVKLFYKKHYPKWQYFTLRLLLKIGSLGRIVLFGILDGRAGANTYVQTFKHA